LNVNTVLVHRELIRTTNTGHPVKRVTSQPEVTMTKKIQQRKQHSDEFKAFIHDISAVPVPAAAWLFISGMGVLWRVARKA
jgi:hypothetical protein